MNKKDVIRNFIISNSHLPKQGTQEWKNARKYFIGGSEVSVLMNKNKNKTIRKLILEKIGHHTFSGNSATYWGNVFEPLIRQYTNNYFQCSIVETGSIPYKKSNLSYSPDGIAHVKKEKIKEIIDEDKLSKDNDHIVLFEFKCPHSRIPNGTIPEYYEPQPMIGMNIIDICEIGIFIEAIYRRCAFYDLQYNNRHVTYGHYNKIKLIKNPLEYGFITIYADELNEKAEYILDLLYNSHGVKKVRQLYDIGTVYDKETFDTILESCVNGEFSIDYSFNKSYNQDIFNAYSYIIDNYNKASYYQSIKTIEKIKSDLDNKIIIGIMPYKLIEVHMNPVYKDSSFIEKNNLVKKAEDVIRFIHAHNELTEKEITKIIKTMTF